jgi:transposase
MAKRTYEISETAEELLDMMKNEKKARFRDRLRMLWFLKTGEAETIMRAAELCGVSRLTAAEWFRRYETGGIPELLLLKTVPGRKRKIFGEVEESLKERLSQPEGFASYDEARIWILENHGLDIKYKTVHKTIRYRLKSKLKTPRPSHMKKDEDEEKEFKKEFPTKVFETIYDTNMPVKIFSYDETRLGLTTSLGKRITLPGVRPVAKIQYVYENYYIYGATEVSGGENFFLEFPNMNTDCFQCFIEKFSEHFPNSINVLLADNARIHKAERLVFPENVRPIFLPSYSPELNPIERFWEHIKSYIKCKTFTDLNEMKDYMADILKNISEKTVASLVGYPYILNAVNV